MLQILLDHLLRHLPYRRAEVPSRPEMPTPVSLLYVRKLLDSGPDAWGRRVIERHFGQSGLSEIDYLLYSPDDRACALSFGLEQQPSAPSRAFNQTLALGN